MQVGLARRGLAAAVASAVLWLLVAEEEDAVAHAAHGGPPVDIFPVAQARVDVAHERRHVGVHAPLRRERHVLNVAADKALKERHVERVVPAERVRGHLWPQLLVVAD